MRKNDVFRLGLSLCILIASYSCQDDEYEDNSFNKYYNANLNMVGQAFIQNVESTPAWETQWATVEKAGNPHPNEVFCVYSPSHGTFTVLPVLEGEEITHVVFYPMTENSEPLIIDGDTEDYPEYVRGFFQAQCYATWEEHQLKVDRKLKTFVYNDSIVPAMRMANPSPYFLPADIWVSFTYYYNATWTNLYVCRAEIGKHVENGLIIAKRSFPNVLFDFPGTTHNVDLIVQNVATYEIASETAIKFLDIAMNHVRTLNYVQRVWAVYCWTPPSGGASGGYYGGFSNGGSGKDSGKGDDLASEYEERFCPVCHKRMSECTCAISFRIEVSPNNEVELAKHYDISVYIGGEMRSEVANVFIEMTKTKYPNHWVRIGGGQPLHYTYKQTMMAFNPGEWVVQVGFQLKSDPTIGYSTSTTKFKVLYPHVDDFKNDPIVVSFFEDLWTKCVSFAESHQSTHEVREFGAFVFLNPDGSYSCTEVEPGPIVALDHAGAHGTISASTGDYEYPSYWNDPFRQKPLIVGTMHTHYPATWAAEGIHFPVGPSKKDIEFAQKIPGLVYDYTNKIKAGDAADNPENPLKIWDYGVKRRVLED